MTSSQNKHRILMLLENESFPEDTRVFLEAKALVEVGFEVTVVCPTGSLAIWSERIAGIQVYRYPKPWELGGFIGYLWEFAYSMVCALVYSVFVLARHGFDVIHVHTPPDMNVLVACCFRLLGKRIVVDHHDLSPELYQAQRGGKGNKLVERALLWFERTAIRSADRLIATNQSQQRVQIERCGADPKRCHVVRNGPDQRFLGEVEPVTSLASDARQKIGFVGIMGIQDGVDRFIEALVILKQRRADFLAVIVGSGPATQSLKELTAQYGLNNQIRFIGLVPYSEVPSYIASFDVCVTPDPSNPYNDSCTTIKTMEYMALGKPTVSFDTHENRITAAESALYASENDIGQFATLIEQLMDDPTLRQTMGEAGRKRVDELYVWDKQKPNLVQLYCELLSVDPSRTAVARSSPSQEKPCRASRESLDVS